MRKRTKLVCLTIGIVLLMISSVLFGMKSASLYILPGFEGLNAGVEGFQPYPFLPTTRIDQMLDSPYLWTSQDPHQASIKVTGGLFNIDVGHVRIHVSTPELYYNWFEEPKAVEYWTKDPDGNWVHVTGRIVVYRIYLSIEELGDAANFVWWHEKIWIALTSTTWNDASQDPTWTEKYGATWEAPLAVYVETVTKNSNDSPHNSFEPSAQGRYVTLYSDMSQSGTISDLGFQQGHDINKTLSNEYAPDSRMRHVGYFAISLTDWGSDVLYPFYDRNPSANLVLKVYTLLLGKYTYTNPEKVEWEKLQGSKSGWLYDLMNFFNQIVMGLQGFFGPIGTALSLIFMAATAFIIVLFIALIIWVLRKATQRSANKTQILARHWNKHLGSSFL